MEYRERIDSPLEAARASQNGMQARLWTALPGIIESVDLSALTCTVQPAIQAVQLSPDGKQTDVNLPLLVDVPFIINRGGGYADTKPIKSGDECLVVFSSRCIDNWWQEGGVQAQFSRRQHDLSDGLAIVGPYSQKTKLQNVSATTSQYRSEDGTLFLEIDHPNKKVRLVSNGITVDVDSNQNQVKVIAPTVVLVGDLHVTGAVIAGFGTGDQITLQQHRHGSITNPIPFPGT